MPLPSSPATLAGMRGARGIMYMLFSNIEAWKNKEVEEDSVSFSEAHRIAVLRVLKDKLGTKQKQRKSFELWNDCTAGGF